LKQVGIVTALRSLIVTILSVPAGSEDTAQPIRVAEPLANPVDAELLRQRVTAVLAEYTALRAEILNRSSVQNALLGLHLTALIAILGSLASSVGRWTVFLVPVEAVVIGLWYMDHAVVIEQIGFHIQTSTEVNIRELLKEPRLMWWESRYMLGVTDRPALHVRPFRRLLPLTFLGPATVAMLLAVAVPGVNAIAGATGATWVYRGRELAFAGALLLFDMVLVAPLAWTFRRRSRLNDLRRETALPPETKP
jgi:hypothetical protein